jgi:hypothetical protein
VILYDYASREDEELEGLTEVVSRQQVFSPTVAGYLRRIEYASDGWASTLISPATPRPVVVADPTRSFGQRSSFAAACASKTSLTAGTQVIL